MRLSRATKARLLRRLNPQALVWLTLGLGVVALAYEVVLIAGLFLGWRLPQAAVGFIFLSVLPVHGFRWWAIARGWGAVGAREATPENLGRQMGLGEDGTHPAALPLQQAVAEKALTQGWLTWRDVLDCARDLGLPARRVAEPLFLGAHAPVARPLHWKRTLHPSAWQAGRMAAAWADAPAPAAPARKPRL